jgi:hypothetical protein
MLFPLWTSSIQLKYICLRVFITVEYTHAAFHLQHGYYVSYLCCSYGCQYSAIISVDTIHANHLTT